MARPKKNPDETPEEAYARHKEMTRERMHRLARVGRDIGEIPAVVNPERKEAARFSFRAFCDSYFIQTFTLPWSPDHLKVIARIEEAVLHGGLFALAMPRGSGKSSLCEASCVWALLYGHRRFVCLIGAEEGSASSMLDSIKTELEGNDLLAEDFPEAIFPIQKLEGISNRAKGQTCDGERTHITWTAKEIVLPSIAGSASGAGIVKVAGITGRIRGMKYKRSDGKSTRPDLVVIDDPQTDESARSPAQCATREGILSGAILGLAGPGQKIAGIMPCTVVQAGDMADRILDREAHPEWGGERLKLVYSWPDREDLWQRYAELRSDGMRKGDRGAEANEFYRLHRDEMDRGAVVAWPERHNPDELSAIQHAYNLRLRDEAAFLAEYQNAPEPPASAEAVQLSAEDICDKINLRERGEVPLEVSHITAAIDVQGEALYWAVVGWSMDFSGWVLDYDCYPEQGRPYYKLRDLQRKLGDLHPGAIEATLHAGLQALTNRILSRLWKRDDGAEMQVGRCLIDANWSESTNVVYSFCRTSPYASVVTPSHGKYIGAATSSMAEWAKKPGDRVGLGWRIPSLAGGRHVRHCTMDTNFWKSFLVARWSCPLGAPGSLSLFGSRPAAHRLFADHLTAENVVEVEAKGRKVNEWKLRPEKPDNHWLDCMVGCAVGASIQGCSLPDLDKQDTKQKERVSFAELQRRKRGGR
jgi:hypothetical protein